MNALGLQLRIMRRCVKKSRLVTPVPSAQYLSLKVTTIMSLKICLE